VRPRPASGLLESQGPRWLVRSLLLGETARDESSDPITAPIARQSR
jgi:hypothetical protein